MSLYVLDCTADCTDTHAQLVLSCMSLMVWHAALKEKLSHIPDQIRDRSKFLRIIRDVATSIKEVLDAVNEVSKHHQADQTMKEHRKVGNGTSVNIGEHADYVVISHCRCWITGKEFL